MNTLRLSKTTTTFSKPFSSLLSTNSISNISSRIYPSLSSSNLNNKYYSSQDLPSRSLFGHHAFRGQAAAPYLKKVGLPEDTMESGKWIVEGNQDKVAQAVLDWARDHGASVYCHQFQPQGSENLRHGYSAQVQKTMFDFDKSGKLRWNFNGKA